MYEIKINVSGQKIPYNVQCKEKPQDLDEKKPHYKGHNIEHHIKTPVQSIYMPVTRADLLT